MDNSASLVNAVLRLTLTTMIYVVYLILLNICCVVNCVLNLLIINSSKHIAQLGRILWRRKISTYHTSSPMAFLCVFSPQLMPEYVFCQNVTLYCITKTDAFL